MDDIAQGLINALDAENIEGNTYNLSAESSISAQDYVREVERILGSRIIASRSFYGYYYIGDLIKWIIKVLARHPDGKRIPSIRDWRCREQHASFDTSAAQKGPELAAHE